MKKDRPTYRLSFCVNYLYSLGIIPISMSYGATFDKAITIVDNYIKCWDNDSKIKISNRMENITESNDGGCEHLQLFRNGISPESLSYADVCNLSWLLTRELKGQINRDHFFYWSWCYYVIEYFHRYKRSSTSAVTIVKDFELVECFSQLVNMLSLRPNNIPLTTNNQFIDEIQRNRYFFAGPISFALLEGLLRRKNSAYVDIDGKVIQRFDFLDSKNRKIQCDLKSNNKGKSEINQIPHLISIFEQLTIPNERGNRKCIGLGELRTETNSAYNKGLDLLLGDTRNTLLHGSRFWMNKVPLVMNLICLLFIDSISPLDYDNTLVEIKDFLKMQESGRRSDSKHGMERLSVHTYYPSNMDY